MTSAAFILGSLPLLIARGAGAEMRRTLGTAVFSGMLGVTLFGIFLTPVFFNVIDWLGATPLFRSRLVRRIVPSLASFWGSAIPWALTRLVASWNRQPGSWEAPEDADDAEDDSRGAAWRPEGRFPVRQAQPPGLGSRYCDDCSRTAQLVTACTTTQLHNSVLSTGY